MNRKTGIQRKKGVPGNQGYKINIIFGYHRYMNISYTMASEIVLRYITIEQKHSEMFVRSTKNGSSILYFCTVLGNAQPPNRECWKKAKTQVYKGLQKLSMANSYASIYKNNYVRQNRSDEALIALKNEIQKCYEEAIEYLKMAIHYYNEAHKQWITYRNRMNFGGEVAIVLMDIAIILAVGYATAGIGVHLTSITAKAGLSAGIAFFDQNSRAIGMDIQGVDKLNWQKIIEKTIIAGLSSLGGGYLQNKLLNKITRKLDFKKIWLFKKGPLGGGYFLATKNQAGFGFRLDEFGFQFRKYLSDFICNSVGKSILAISIETAIHSLTEKEILRKDQDKLLDKIAIEFAKNFAKQNEKHLLLLAKFK
jgi:hypothetical protein